MAGETRRTVTVLFSDVVESTALGERLDPETLRLVMSRWFTAAEEVLERHGGTVEKFIGDAVMAVFGVPRAHEDDALRAVRAAAEMRESLERLNDELAHVPGARLAIRTGVNTGEGVAGTSTARQSLLTGDVVNTAKRLEQAAPSGEILIGAMTRELVRGAAELECLTPVRAKGKADPVPAWRVVSVDLGAEGILRRLDAPLVGRRGELDRLKDALARAVTDRACVAVTVLGPAGIGKSRLAVELAAELGDTARFLTGRCLPYGTGITFWPLGEIVRRAGGLDGVTAALGHDPDGPLLVERLAAAVGDSPGPASNDEIFWAVRRFVQALAADRPLVLCIEDVHWAEPTMHDLIEYLAGWTRGVPVLLLSLARPEQLGAHAGPIGAEQIVLEPLSAGEADRLVSGLGVSDPTVRARIVQTADGNPLFVEQLAAMLADGSGKPFVVPPSIRALLAARLDALPKAERSALERAAVIGREFRRETLAALTPRDERGSVGRPLLALVRKGLLRPAPDGSDSDDVLRFRHALIRDAAYAGLPKAERAVLHERVASWLDEHDDPGSRAELDEIVGFHVEQAFLYRRQLGHADELTSMLRAMAAARLGTAGRKAFARDDMPAAVALLERATAMTPPEERERLSLDWLLACGLWEVGAGERSLAALEALEADARELGDRRIEWHARLERVAHLETTGAETPDVVRAVSRQAIAVFEELGDHAGLAVAWRRIAVAERRDGRYGSSEGPSALAMEHARAAADAHEEARAVDGLCTALLYGPAPAAEAAERCRAMLDRSQGRPAMTANVLSSLAGLECMLGRFDQARQAYGRARAMYEELGLRMPLAGLTTIGVPLELLAGDPVAAEAEARYGIAILEPGGLEGELSPALAEALLAQGRFDDAVGALCPPDASHGTAWQVQWLMVRSRLDSGLGDTVAAVEHAHAATELAAGMDDLNLAADAWLALGLALALAGSQQDAVAAENRARRLYAEKGNLVALDRARVSPLSPEGLRSL